MEEESPQVANAVFQRVSIFVVVESFEGFELVLSR